MSRKKKRALKKKAKIILLLFVVFWIIVGLFLYFNKNNNKDSLKDIGYNYSEIEEINKYVSDKNIDYLIKYGYCKDLMSFITDENYKDNNLKKYLEYYKKYNVSPNKIIIWVNDYNDLDLEFDETTLSFLQQDYFIFKNLDRYLNYYKNNKDKTFKEIVKDVNSNIDKTFYVDVSKSNTSKGNLLIVNKFYYLDENYVPNDLVSLDAEYGRTSVKLKKEAYENFKKMADSAKKEGLEIYIRSGYRSYSDQQNMYNYYVSNDGVNEADTYSARPGYSEHQTGLAIDIIKGKTGSYDDFKNSKEFTWMKENSYKYGFILRYTKENEYITGYVYEPWHYRYVGEKVAKEIYEKGITYEEYYAYYVE